MCWEQKVCTHQLAPLASASCAAGSGQASLLLPRHWDVALDPASFSHLEHSQSKGKAHLK